MNRINSLLIILVYAVAVFLYSTTSGFKKEFPTLYVYLVKQKSYRDLRNNSTIKNLIQRSGDRGGLVFLASLSILTTLYIVRGRSKKGNKSGKNNKELNQISSKNEIVFVEITDEPELKNGKPKLNKANKIIYKKKEYYPTYDFSNTPESFLINSVHPKVEKSLQAYLNGLLLSLYEKNYIPTSSGKLLSTGHPGQYIVKLNNKSQIDEMAMFRDIRWFKEEEVNTIKKELFPSVEINKSNVIVHLNGIQLTKEVIHRGLEKFQNFYKVELKTIFNVEDDAIEFKYKTKLERVFVDSKEQKRNQLLKEKHEATLRDMGTLKKLSEGQELTPEESKIYKKYEKAKSNIHQSIPDKFNEWNERIISPLKKYAKENLEEYVFLGELEDSNINLKTQINWQLSQAPHFLIVGQTRSGKTKTVLSLVSTFKQAYPECDFLFGDGKSSMDYDPFADKMSQYPVAKMSTSDDPLIELANLIFIGWAEYEKRRRLFEEFKEKTGRSPSTYIDYNKYLKERDDFKAELEEARSEGRSNLSELEKRYDSEFKKLEGYEYIHRYFMVIDEFAAFAQASEISVDKAINIKGTIFNYLNRLLREAASQGFTIILASQRAQQTDFPTPIRTNLTTWLIHSVNSKDASFLELSGHVEKLSTGKYILKVNGLWCTDTGTNIIRCSMPYIGNDPAPLLNLMELKSKEHLEFDYDLIYNNGQDLSNKSMSINLAYRYIKQSLIVREGYDIIEIHNPEHNYLSLVFKDGNKKYAIGVINDDEAGNHSFINKVKAEKENYYEYMIVFFVLGKNPKIHKALADELPRAVFLFESEFLRPLKLAMKHNQEGSSEKVWPEVVRGLFAQAEMVDEFKKSSDVDVLINLEELNRIRNIKGSQRKGDAFAAWMLEFEKRMGHDTHDATDLIKQGIIPNVFANSRADGGLDLLRWTDKENKVGYAIQLKNFTSKALSPEILSRLIATKELYKEMGFTFEKLILITTGKLTKQARMEADKCNITVIDGVELDQMVKDYNMPGKIKEESFSYPYKISQSNLSKDEKNQLIIDVLDRGNIPEINRRVKKGES